MKSVSVAGVELRSTLVGWGHMGSQPTGRTGRPSGLSLDSDLQQNLPLRLQARF